MELNYNLLLSVVSYNYSITSDKLDLKMARAYLSAKCCAIAAAFGRLLIVLATLGPIILKFHYSYTKYKNSDREKRRERACSTDICLRGVRGIYRN